MREIIGNLKLVLVTELVWFYFISLYELIYLDQYILLILPNLLALLDLNKQVEETEQARIKDQEENRKKQAELTWRQNLSLCHVNRQS